MTDDRLDEEEEQLVDNEMELDPRSRNILNGGK